jgi:hypothetical protein
MEEIKETSLKQTTTIEGKTQKKSLKYQQDKDNEKVKGIFRFFEVPGGELKFFYRAYKGEQPERYKLRDGEVCSIPLGVAKHLNKRGWYPVHTHAVDDDGKSIYKIGEKKRRFGFQSMEFIDPEDFDSVEPMLVKVEKI